MQIKCIALDLDRTTLNSQGHLSEANRTAIERAVNAGIHVTVASGRPLDSLPAEVTEISGIRYAITSNGAAVYDLYTGKCLRQYKMTPESVMEILEQTVPEKMCGYFSDMGISYEAFIDGKAYAERRYVEDPVRFGATPHAVGYIKETRTPVGNMRKFIREHCSELDSMDLVVKSEEGKEKLWKTLSQTVKDVYITSSVRQLLEISHRDAGKESGAAFLLEYLGLEREMLAAFGDGDNDAGLLKYAGIGFAVANASERCRAAADIIAASNDENGVAGGIEQILRLS